jgi:hypothetical protein
MSITQDGCLKKGQFRASFAEGPEISETVSEMFPVLGNAFLAYLSGIFGLVFPCFRDFSFLARV